MPYIIDINASGPRPYGDIHDNFPGEVLVPVIWQDEQYGRIMEQYGIAYLAVLRPMGIAGRVAACFTKQTRYADALDAINARVAEGTLPEGSAQQALGELACADGRFEAKWGEYLPK